MPARPGAGTEGSTVLPAGPTQLPPSGLGDSLPATRETPVDDAVNGQEHPQPLFEVDEMVAGHFRVLGQLGRGGMAQVWEAKDLELDRRVALKAARPRPPVPPPTSSSRRSSTSSWSSSGRRYHFFPRHAEHRPQRN